MPVGTIAGATPQGIESFGSALRPSFSEYIWQLSPEDFPLFEMFDKASIDQVEDSWQADVLGDAEDSSQNEGFSYTTVAPVDPKWLKSCTQINYRGYGATKTRQAAAHKGKKNLLNYEGTKKAKELKSDIVKAMLENTIRRLGTTSLKGVTPGFLYWLKDTTGTGNSATADFGLGTRNSGKFSVNIVDAQGDYLNEILVNKAIQQNWQINSNPGVLIGSGNHVALMQDFTGGIIRSQDAKYPTLKNVTKVYSSFFGDIEVQAIREMASKTWAMIIEPDLWEIAIFRNFEKVDVNPNTASKIEKGIEIEWMFKCKNPHGNTLIDDLHE